jgi:hypothetical protein
MIPSYSMVGDIANMIPDCSTVGDIALGTSKASNLTQGKTILKSLNHNTIFISVKRIWNIR